MTIALLIVCQWWCLLYTLLKTIQLRGLPSLAKWGKEKCAREERMLLVTDG